MNGIKQPEKIALVTLEYPPQVGGVGRYYKRLIEDLDNVKVLHMQGAEWAPWWRSIFRLRRWLKERSISRVVVGQVLPIGTMVWLLSLFTNISYTVFIHGMDIAVPQKHLRKLWLVRRILMQAKRVIVVSQYTKQRVIDAVPNISEKRITILSPGAYLTPENCTPADKRIVTNDKRYILSVGRLVSRKGFDNAIKAFASIAAQYPDVDYVILGKGQDQARLESIIADNNLQDRVHIISAASDEVIAAAYRDAEFFVMPSRINSNQDFEGFGIVVLEANSFEKPAIGGNDAGMQDAIIHGKTGALVNPNNIEEIAQTMSDWLAEPELVQRLGVHAKMWQQSEHNWPRKIEKFISIVSQ